MYGGIIDFRMSKRSSCRRDDVLTDLENKFSCLAVVVVSAALVHCKHAGTSEILKSLEDKLTSAAVPATLIQYNTVSTSEILVNDYCTARTPVCLSNNDCHLRRMGGFS
jgi:hypothetical protein